MSVAPVASIQLDDWNQTSSVVQTNARQLGERPNQSMNLEGDGVVTQQLKPAVGGLAA